MAFKDITDPDAVWRAIAEFDQRGREAFLKQYEFGEASMYFVRNGDDWYDAKALAGVAHKHQHGQPLRAEEFSGGEDTVVAQLRKIGFSVERAGQQPDWTADELMLALCLYLSFWDEAGKYRKNAKQVKNLSNELKNLPIFEASVRKHPKFRTPGSVSLKLGNFARLDERVNGDRLDHGGKADVVAWDRWHAVPKELERAVEKIRNLASFESVGQELEDEDELSGNEGKILYRVHRRYERDRKLVNEKKRQAQRKHGKLACEVCDFDSEAVYGVPGVIDVHHIVPLHEVGERTTNVDDLALLCPTCHRTVHKHTPFLTPEELKERIKPR